MEYNLDTIKDLVTIGKPFIDPIISSIIKPKIDQLSKWIKRQHIRGQEDSGWFENKFEEYLARTYNYCQNINILIFQNQQIKIKDIYYPLTIQSSKDKSRYHIDDFPLSILNKYQKILISDTAGMGKSTMMKWIGTKVIENALGVPILIELRNLKDNHSILDEIYTQLNPIDGSFDKDLILRFIELGHFIILLDGFDEVQFKNQEVIIKDIRDFINKASKNYFILTSRPEGALATFGDFQMFNIKPLDEKEAFQLIKQYDSICPIKIGDKLINDIKANFNQTRELLGNPFLVSLIYSTYTYNKDIPSTKITFYEEIYSALFKRHDLSKDGWTRNKKSKLDIQQFKIILRQLAFDTAIIGTIVYSESEIAQHISTAKQKCPGIEFNTSDFLDDLLSSVPLFQKDGSKIKWAHKSLQDYFAADFIAFNGRKEEIIDRVYKSEKDVFLNILELFFELDYKTFRKIIIQPLLLDFINHCETTYKDFPDILEKELNDRKRRTFQVDYILQKAGVRVPASNILEMITKKYPDIQIRRGRTYIMHREDVIVFISSTFKRTIIELLANKQLSFFSSQSEAVKSVNLNLPSNDCYLVDDSTNSILNSKKNFSIVNSILYSPTHFNDRKSDMLDIDKSKSELEAIQEEIALEKRIDNFKDI